MRHGIDLKPIHNVKDAGQSPLAGSQIALGRIHFRFILETYSCAALDGAMRHGGAYRDRTDDLKLAKLALSQLS